MRSDPREPATADLVSRVLWRFCIYNGKNEEQANEIVQLFLDHFGLKAKMRGRPPKDEITVALQLEEQGVSRQKIYQQLGKSDRDSKTALREAMRQRKARANKKKPSKKSVSPEKKNGASEQG